MEISLYNFIVLFCIVPLLLYKCTDIPQWLFKKARRVPPKRLLLVAAFLLVGSAVTLATVCDSVWTIRFFSFGVAGLACLLHYLYTASMDKARKQEETQDNAQQ